MLKRHSPHQIMHASRPSHVLPKKFTCQRGEEMAAWPFPRLWRSTDSFLFQMTLVAILMPLILGDCNPPPKLPFATPIQRFYVTTYTTGTVLKYTCNLGYKKINASHLTCQFSGEWVYTIFCVKKECKHPGGLTNGKIEMKTNLAYGSTIQFICSKGFQLVGEATSQCHIEGKGVNWSNPLPECVSVKCESPPAISNGKHSGGDEDIFTYGSSVTYGCNPNFLLIGNATIFCSVVNKTIGVWSPGPPTCKKITCQKPQIPKAILASGFQAVYSYKDTIVISCMNGYVLKGSSSIRCEANNQWYPAVPTCQPHEPRGCQNLPDIPFASWESNTLARNMTTFGVGTHLKYQCKPGYRFVSGEPQTVTCQENLKWTPSRGCEKVCCPKPNLENIRIISERRDLTHVCFYTYGDYIFYMCDKGYIPASTDGRSSCQVDGKWAPKTPSCKSALCSKPEIQNGKLSVTKDHYFEFENVTVYCDNGYKVVGPYNIMCSEKNMWHPVVPKCVKVVLTGCESVLSGRKLLQCLPQSDDVIKALQAYKLILEIEQLQAEKDMWIKNYQTFSKNKAMKGLLVSLSKYAGSIPGNFTHPDSGRLSKRSPSPSLSFSIMACKFQGIFQALWPLGLLSLLWCPAVLCGCDFPPRIAHGHHKMVHSYNIFKYEVLYKCDEGYTLVGQAKLSCSSSQWTPAAPQCKALCLKPEIENGKLSVDDIRYVEMENVTVLCDSGFSVVGPQNITCLENGTWYPEVPKCEWDVPEGCEQVLQGRKLTQCLQSAEEVKMALEMYKLSLEIELLELQRGKARHPVLESST
ncbi:zona pellucida sperm-binding protein 3 receptor-like [Perognathus longimembris pacificus]|uniref:zona pellucida sperm-binding protein 3 receptor-like n=1 Tax=Perognathus longimembris pacificus TaxID=214514 RepID=UPI002019E98D|nr:zona pellucida sperm-binding protein 3 receptor-like [Perognathus longimembris pacificus]